MSLDVKGRNGIQFRRSCLDSVFALIKTGALQEPLGEWVGGGDVGGSQSLRAVAHSIRATSIQPNPSGDHPALWAWALPPPPAAAAPSNAAVQLGPPQPALQPHGVVSLQLQQVSPIRAVERRHHSQCRC